MLPNSREIEKTQLIFFSFLDFFFSIDLWWPQKRHKKISLYFCELSCVLKQVPVESTAGNLYYFLRNSLKCKHPVDTNLRFFWCLLSSCRHCAVSEYTYHITWYTTGRAVFWLVFYFTEAKSENSSEQLNCKTTYKRSAVTSNCLKLPTYLKHTVEIAKVTHIPFTLPP